MKKKRYVRSKRGKMDASLAPSIEAVNIALIGGKQIDGAVPVSIRDPLPVSVTSLPAIRPFQAMLPFTPHGRVLIECIDVAQTGNDAQISIQLGGTTISWPVDGQTHSPLKVAIYADGQIAATSGNVCISGRYID